MTYATPTSEEELISCLKEIFLHYRKQKEVYVEEELEELVLERLEFVPLNDEQLEEKARVLLSPKFTARINEYKEKLFSEISKLETEKVGIESEKEILIEGVETAYKKASRSLRSSSVKNGTAVLGIFDNEAIELVKEKEIKIAEIEAKTQERIIEIDAEIQSLNSKIDQAEQTYSTLEEEEILAKVEELRSEQTKTEYEIIKYNSSLYEKEVKYRNSYAKMTADLKFKYASLAQVELSKTQLIEMGYYKDALDCANSFYGTLDSSVAYQAILKNVELMTYLEDYYESFLYSYKIKI